MPILKQCKDNYSNSPEFLIEKEKVIYILLKASLEGLQKCRIPKVKFGESLKEMLLQEGFVVEYDRILSDLYVEGWDKNNYKPRSHGLLWTSK